MIDMPGGAGPLWFPLYFVDTYSCCMHTVPSCSIVSHLLHMIDHDMCLYLVIVEMPGAVVATGQSCSVCSSPHESDVCMGAWHGPPYIHATPSMFHAISPMEGEAARSSPRLQGTGGE